MVERRSAVARAPATCIAYICTKESPCDTTSRSESPMPSRIKPLESWAESHRTTSPSRSGRTSPTDAMNMSVAIEMTMNFAWGLTYGHSLRSKRPS